MQTKASENADNQDFLTNTIQMHSKFTVHDAKMVVSGYVRTEIQSKLSNIIIPDCIATICRQYYGFRFLNPMKDAANFITKHNIAKSIQLKIEGNKMMSQNQFGNALELYTSALSENIKDAKIFCNRCLCYIKLYDFQRALMDGKYAIKYDPLWYKTWLRMAQSFEGLHHYQEALDMMKQALNAYIISARTEIRPYKTYEMLLKYQESLKIKMLESANHANQRISHIISDEERGCIIPKEWKQDLKRIENEQGVTLKMLTLMSPKRIQGYYSCIIPSTLRSNIHDPNWAYWHSREWINKIFLFTELNYYKLMIECNNDDIYCQHEYIKNRAPKLKEGEEWCIKWSATNEIYLGKRIFVLTIAHQTYYHQIFIDYSFCIPSANYIIECILKAMMSPIDVFWQVRTKHMAPPGRRPHLIRFAGRLKHVFHAVAKEMEMYDVLCELEPIHPDWIQKQDSDPFGWDYLTQKPEYLTQNLDNHISIYLNDK